jgi:hypothetical protein
MEDITMDQEKRIQDAADLAMNYQLAINKGELDNAFEMVLPKERDAVSKEAFIREKLGVDTIIENIIKYHPDIGTIKVEEATYDEKSKKYRISLKERFPDANMLSPIFSEVMIDFFGLTDEKFDQKKFKKKIKKAISKRKALFKKGQLLDVIITENVEEFEGKLFISPGWIEEIRKAEEKRALRQKTEVLSTEVWKAQGHEGSIFKALELYRELIKMDESYAEKYGDIEERAVIVPKISIEQIPSDMDSSSMVKVKITNNSDKPIVSVNYECELFDENNEKIYSQINQIYVSDKIQPGASSEEWAFFDSEAGAKRKEVRLKIVNVTLK